MDRRRQHLRSDLGKSRIALAAGRRRTRLSWQTERPAGPHYSETGVVSWQDRSTRSFWSAISGKDPEIRRTQDGRPIANLSVATSESWRDKNTGERKEKTEWHRVVIFNEGLCKIAEQYLKKGAKVYLEGQLQTRKWQDKDGNDKYSTEVVLQGFNSSLTMLDGRGGGGRRQRARFGRGSDFGRRLSVGRASASRRWRARGGGRRGDMDDEIPF